jgi:hypothetical protein
MTGRSSRVARWIAGLVGAVLIALVLMRALHTTTVGIRIVDSIPEGFWRAYHRLSGLSQVGDVERVQDADGLVLALACLVVSGGVVAAFAAFLGRRARRRV